MNVINNIINRLNFIISEVPQKLMEYSDIELSYKPAVSKWSKKEILGHLCDSAINNISSFTKAQFEDEPFKVIPYAQDYWVKVNHYNKMVIDEIIDYFSGVNKQIVQIISNIPEEKLGIICDIGEAAYRDCEVEKTLLWLIEEYLVHMEYHLRQVIRDI